MTFPERFSSHIAESTSVNIFREKTPDDWVIRDLTERDYGVDLFVEVPFENRLRGFMCNIQLKGRESLTWRQLEEDCEVSVLSGFKANTAHYLNSLPAPSFVVVTDNTERRAFYQPLEHVFRKQFDKVWTQDTISIRFERDLEFGTPLGNGLLLPFIVRETNYERFESALITFLSLTEEFFNVLRRPVGTDFHILSDADDVLSFRHTHHILNVLAEGFMLDKTPSPFLEVTRNVARAMNNENDEVYELTLQILSEELLPLFASLLRKAREMIVETYEHYWLAINRELFFRCFNMSWQLEDYDKKTQSYAEHSYECRPKLDFEVLASGGGRGGSRSSRSPVRP